ncbi:MAG: tRNA lysidine(34) synthetase TilS [Rikenellaceae bacterium]
MQLISRFKNELQKSRVLDFTDKILIGVSGGRDSMCLTHILHTLGYDIAIAHCNFSLRDSESDCDEDFVRDYAAQNNIPFYINRFDTRLEAQINGESIQIAARRLRYDWFNELSQGNKFSVVAIAHNSDDSAETFFINLSRGTGIKGLRGIQNKRDNIVRPLIFATRAEITDFCIENNIAYRDDSSNSSNKYLRNKIRHQIMPVFKELNENFNSTMLSTVENVSQSYELLEFFIADVKKRSLKSDRNQCVIDLTYIKQTPTPSYTLFEIIREWGFVRKQCEAIMSADFEQKSGLQYFSKDYMLLLNRSKLILNSIDSLANEQCVENNLVISDVSDYSYGNFHIKMEVVDIEDVKSLRTAPNIALLDADMVKMPIIARRFENGDTFIPFGMKGSKKLSDFMIDNKLSVIQKERLIVFESANKILWVAPYRISDLFRITHNTKKVFKISVLGAPLSTL